MTRGNVLVVDLNNYARYPTLAIGYLTAALRAAGFGVELLSPLAHGQTGVMRERQARASDHLKNLVYMAPPAPLRHRQDWLYDRYAAWSERMTRVERELLRSEIERSRPDVILLSAYLSHRQRVEFIAGLSAQRSIPVLLGGPAFNFPNVGSEWAEIPGVTSVYGGEAESTIVQLVESLLRDRPLPVKVGSHTSLPGASTQGYRESIDPLADLNALPVPDFSDFPWDRYPHRIIPLMATRGCSWGHCTFCSDVATASGRFYRTRSAQHLLHEIEMQAQRYKATDFIFLDIKLNSDVGLWHSLIDGIQDRVPGARWIGTVHVNSTGENGLDEHTLAKAQASGLTRVSFGLESGSQRVLRLMGKGCKVELNEAFVRNASRAGISVRSTMMVGYPGESAADVDLSAEFIERNAEHLDRISLCRFKPMPGTRFERLYQRRPGRFSDIRVTQWNYGRARASYHSSQMQDPVYRRSVRKLLRAVHEINRRPLRNNLGQFDGLM